METSSISKWQIDAQELLANKRYAEAIQTYEQAVDVEPSVRSHYWNLGLAYLLNGDEELAQATWLLVLAEADNHHADSWLSELLLILDDEAGRQQEQENYTQAWTVRQHIRELDPLNINNLLLLLQLSVLADLFDPENFAEWHVIGLLTDDSPSDVHLSLIIKTIEILLDRHYAEPQTIEFVKACVTAFKNEPLRLVNTLINQSNIIGHAKRCKPAAAQLLEAGLSLGYNHERIVDYLSYLSLFYQDICRYGEGIAVAERAHQLADSLYLKISATHVWLRGLMATGGHWTEAQALFQEHIELMNQVIEEKPEDLPSNVTRWMYNSPYFAPYLRDDLGENRYIQNKMAAIAQLNTRKQKSEVVDRFSEGLKLRVQQQPTSNRCLNIGYVSSCLRRHSVGWLARWLFKYHNREHVKVHSYLISYRDNEFDPVRDWIIRHTDVVHKLDADSSNIANHIYDDHIDILIDLDSATLDTACEVMALKPAPVQVSWLGWDASGVPAIDYYIVDPYVVPDNADHHYSETLWRLPQTYVAIDGFEVGVPNLRRCDIDIPDDAVVFLSAQRGHKRYPPTVRLQMQIIQQVPNSYFLIKSLEHDDSLKQFFFQMAEEEGVSRSRLRFMPDVPSEDVHRANLGIADVVLDTYPYNGATTTLETLWAGVPLVTRVGTTFSSRNSYTMLMNVGVEEGIAWTDQEYVEWGVRLGIDESLRQDIKWKLWRSRQTAPLWDAKKFTQEMEKAYQQMWERFIDNSQ